MMAIKYQNSFMLLRDSLRNVQSWLSSSLKKGKAAPVCAAQPGTVAGYSHHHSPPRQGWKQVRKEHSVITAELGSHSEMALPPDCTQSRAKPHSLAPSLKPPAQTQIPYLCFLTHSESPHGMCLPVLQPTSQEAQLSPLWVRVYGCGLWLEDIDKT